VCLVITATDILDYGPGRPGIWPSGKSAGSGLIFGQIIGFSGFQNSESRQVGGISTFEDFSHSVA